MRYGGNNADDILVKVDGASMANSLEVRTPFLDYRLIELSFKIPLEHKIEKNVGKTGMMALSPFLHQSSQDLWQLHMLGKEVKNCSPAVTNRIRF